MISDNEVSTLLTDYCEEFRGNERVGGLQYLRNLYAFAESVQARNILEVGFGWGFSSVAFMASLSKRGGRLTSIDPFYEHKPIEQLEAVARISHKLDVDWNIKIIDSMRFRTKETYDILYIDGNPGLALHDFYSFHHLVRRRDKNHLRSGGLVIMDGYPDQFPITPAVEELGGYFPMFYKQKCAHAVFHC